MTRREDDLALQVKEAERKWYASNRAIADRDEKLAAANQQLDAMRAERDATRDELCSLTSGVQCALAPMFEGESLGTGSHELAVEVESMLRSLRSELAAPVAHEADAKPDGYMVSGVDGKGNAYQWYSKTDPGKPPGVVTPLYNVRPAPVATRNPSDCTGCGANKDIEACVCPAPVAPVPLRRNKWSFRRSTNSPLYAFSIARDGVIVGHVENGDVAQQLRDDLYPIAPVAPVPGTSEVVAYLYQHHTTDRVCAFTARERWDASAVTGWTETPLYRAAPPAPARTLVREWYEDANGDPMEPGVTRHPDGAKAKRVTRWRKVSLGTRGRK